MSVILIFFHLFNWIGLEAFGKRPFDPLMCLILTHSDTITNAISPMSHAIPPT